MRRLAATILFLGVTLGAGPGCAAETDRDWSTTKRQIRDAFPDVKQLSTEDLAAWLASDRSPPILLDTRTPEEFAVSHLLGAISATDVVQAVSALDEFDPPQPIVVYCSVGYRSSALAEQLTERGYDHVMNLEGSIFEWANKGRPVVRDDLEVEAVHPYDEDWGQLLNRQLWQTHVETGSR